MLVATILDMQFYSVILQSFGSCCSPYLPPFYTSAFLTSACLHLQHSHPQHLMCETASRDPQTHSGLHSCFFQHSRSMIHIDPNDPFPADLISYRCGPCFPKKFVAYLWVVNVPFSFFPSSALSRVQNARQAPEKLIHSNQFHFPQTLCSLLLEKQNSFAGEDTMVTKENKKAKRCDILPSGANFLTSGWMHFVIRNIFSWPYSTSQASHWCSQTPNLCKQYIFRIISDVLFLMSHTLSPFQLH